MKRPFFQCVSSADPLSLLFEKLPPRPPLFPSRMLHPGGRTWTPDRRRAEPTLMKAATLGPVAVALALLATPIVRAETPAPTFEGQVRPILKAYCFDCHGDAD